MALADTSPLRLAFAGTPAFAATILAQLVTAHTVAAVYSQPAKPTGRGRKLTVSAVEQLAHKLDINAYTPTSMRHETDRLATLELDALIVVAYGRLLPEPVLKLPRHGCINVHASLLPRWRGAAPIERAMLAGDRITGVSIMQMDAGLDTGPVLHQVQCPILETDIGDTLRDRLATLGARALLDTLARLSDLSPTPQSDDGVTYAAKLVPADSVTDWRRPAAAIAAQIRALNSRQPAFCNVQGERVRLLFAESLELRHDHQPGTVVSCDRHGLVVACGVGTVRITRLALTRGRGRPMEIAALLNGYPDLFTVGQVLDDSR
jgi:methionyl-tRNA formyltransferase